MSPSPTSVGQNPLTGITYKVLSVFVFMGMTSLIKFSGQLPAGQIVFFRSFFAIPPILVFLAYHGELRGAFRTKRPLGHFARGFIGVGSMGLSFFALTRLPLPEAITLNYAQPLLVVVFSAIFLGETIRAYRWTAVTVGLIGVVIVSWPKLTLFGSGGVLGHDEAAGVVAALTAAAVSAVVMLLIRSLVQSEKTSTIVLYFSLTASAFALLTIPFGWQSMSLAQTLALIGSGICGGLGQIFMTEAYRHAEASTVAPFEYTSLILGVAVGYFIFSEVPTIHVVTGGTIVVAAGIYIIWRERQLGLERAAAKRVTPPQ